MTDLAITIGRTVCEAVLSSGRCYDHAAMLPLGFAIVIAGGGLLVAIARLLAKRM